MNKRKTGKQERPRQGGSYVRQASGGLKRVEFTAPSDGPPAPEAEEPAATDTDTATDPSATTGPDTTTQEG